MADYYILTDDDAEFERAQGVFQAIPADLPHGKYTPAELDAIASLYCASYINLMDAKHAKIARKQKGRQKGDKRRTQQNMAGLRALIYHVAEVEHPVTVRQTFYRLSSYGVIAKTQGEYNGTVVRQMVEMRRAGTLPFAWVADSTRWMHKHQSYSGLEDALRNTARTYRRDLWSRSPVYIEIWIEKESLAGVVMDVTDPFDVPLMPAKGFSSHTFLFETAENIRAIGKPTHIYLLGDHDPSGQDALRHTRKTLLEYVAGAVPVSFEVLAVTPEQIEAWKLPDRPPKKGDSRAKKWKGKKWVDLDAIPSPQLRALVREAIERHINPHERQALESIEASERQTLEYIVSVLPHLRGAA